MALLVFSSGCDQQQGPAKVVLTERPNYALDPQHTAWLHSHLPNETVAYLNVPTPWNYLFDPKADAMHPVQSLPAHQAQVDKIKQGVKDHYFQYIPDPYLGLAGLLVEHSKTSLEVAVINNASGALLPTVAVGTRLQNIASEQLTTHVNQMLGMMMPGLNLEQQADPALWTFTVGQFPAFMRFDEASGRLLVYGGMGASQEKLDALWDQAKPDHLAKIKQLNQAADPSGLNLKMWVAAARLYQMGKAFVPPHEQANITQLGLDQMDYVWAGTESSQGQSALAVHVLMPETGWRLALPRAHDWFDVELAGQPRSVWQLTLPTADQFKQGLAHFGVADAFTDSSDKDVKAWQAFFDRLGFDGYDWLNAYHQQVLFVSDDSGSWIAMKVKDTALNEKIEQSFYQNMEVEPRSSQLEGADIQHVHFSFYRQMFLAQDVMPADAEHLEAFFNVFKDHVYWYVKDGVYYMSQVPQVLAMKQNHSNPMSLSSWLEKNQGGDWDSAILAYGKDVQHLPQDLYHFYLLLLQSVGDLAQTEVDLFALPTAERLNLPEQGRINLTVSSDAEKVSFRFAYEYSLLEPVLSAEGGLATLAVVGILAAYAIPAYNDYTIRAKVGEQMAWSAGIKMAVAEQYISTNSFAGINQMVDLPSAQFSVDEETGLITIGLDGVDDRFGPDDAIYLEPVVSEGYIEWYCYSNIKFAYLPAECRD
ncbi:pilin [Marinicella meishanensis]|uniref:pilin n=1 Tax=Marinicella meishanensis TaxID=2873263 RepID=UPI001CBE7731|nr:pilin [Marinicella sp. NBU2979]